MNRIDDVHIATFEGEITQRRGDALDAGAKAFSAVRGDENLPSVVLEDLRRGTFP